MVVAHSSRETITAIVLRAAGKDRISDDLANSLPELARMLQGAALLDTTQDLQLALPTEYTLGRENYLKTNA